MYRNICVAVDLEVPERVHALVRAARLFAHEESRFLVVSVLPFRSNSMVSNFLPKDYRRKIKDEMHQRLDALLVEYDWQAGALRTEIYSGSIYEEVVDAAKSEACDLLVIGSGRLKHGGLGGNAHRMAQFFNGSVFIVR